MSDPNRDRRSSPTRPAKTKVSPRASSTGRSSRPPRQLSTLQKVSKSAIELAELLESILVWVWRSWFPPKRQQVDVSRKYKRPLRHD
jgi:hypothetical protein